MQQQQGDEATQKTYTSLLSKSLTACLPRNLLCWTLSYLTTHSTTHPTNTTTNANDCSTDQLPNRA